MFCARGIHGLTLLTLFLLPADPAFTRSRTRPPSAGEMKELVDYLTGHWQTPEDYIVSKFARHDIVFVGELHRIRHDPLLIHALIPRLHAAGIYDLGSEFALREDQETIDRLTTADTYDETLARRLVFRRLSTWGYKEYIDIYRAAWALNHSLPREAPRFRVVGLMYRADWAALTGERTPEIMRRVWHQGSPDRFMARVVLDEFVAKGRKALIYSGSHHALTRYHQPNYNFETQELYGFTDDRMGNLVYREIGEKAFNIYLHSPWLSRRSSDEWVLPAGGAIDAVMHELRGRRVGFDVEGSPFGRLPDSTSYYAIGHDGFRLGQFADGYIVQGPVVEYQRCTVDPQFITDDNFLEALEGLASHEARKQATSPAVLFRWMRDDADIQRMVRGLGR
jgi:hypothetical protein